MQRAVGVAVELERVSRWICIHMHSTHSMHMPKRTSLSWRQQPLEGLVTVAAAVAARLTTLTVERQPLAAMSASVGPPARVGEGG